MFLHGCCSYHCLRDSQNEEPSAFIDDMCARSERTWIECNRLSSSGLGTGVLNVVGRYNDSFWGASERRMTEPANDNE